MLKKILTLTALVALIFSAQAAPTDKKPVASETSAEVKSNREASLVAESMFDHEKGTLGGDLDKVYPDDIANLVDTHSKLTAEKKLATEDDHVKAVFKNKLSAVGKHLKDLDSNSEKKYIEELQKAYNANKDKMSRSSRLRYLGFITKAKIRNFLRRTGSSLKFWKSWNWNKDKSAKSTAEEKTPAAKEKADATKAKADETTDTAGPSNPKTGTEEST